MSFSKEVELYPPIKTFFESQGYEVKAEVGAADVVARRGDETVIIEMKLRFSLELLYQAVDRLRLTDQVFLVIPRVSGRAGYRKLKSQVTLCRRLGVGLITIRHRDTYLEQLCAPGPYAPRKSKVKQQRLAAQFDRLKGDPNDGGAERHGLVTGYRQDALRCAAFLAEHGAQKGAEVAKAAQVPTATRIMADNHYGWFERVDRGIYGLTTAGSQGLAHWAYSWEEG